MHLKIIDKSWCCQIDVTTKCAKSCLYCSRYNKHIRPDQRLDMPIEQFERSIDSLKNWPAVIGIIGGEPLLYSHFGEMCEIIRSRFEKSRVGFWTSGGNNWTKYKSMIDETFGIIALNEHNESQQSKCKHQRLTVSIKDVIKEASYMNELIDDCWVYRTWCPSINIKGAFFCEIAAAQDLLLDGPGGWEINGAGDWWKKTPEEIYKQRDVYCKNCGMCIPMERDLIECGIEKVSPSLYALLKEHNSSKIEIGKDIEIFDQTLTIDDCEKNKLTWYPGNYRGDKKDDKTASEGAGSTIFGTSKPTIEIMTMWYNEEFLAPYFLNHYRDIDLIHIFIDSDTNDKTRDIISLYNNVLIHEFSFPDTMDDIIKINLFNDFYHTINGDYVVLVDSDEFIFDIRSHLKKHNETLHYTKLWNVYRHIDDNDLDSLLPIRDQRRHGVSDFEGFDIYTKPNIVRSGIEDFKWTPGHHGAILKSRDVRFKHLSKNLDLACQSILVGAHWSMADQKYAIDRRILGRKQRQSNENIKKGLTIQHHNITEQYLIEQFKKHENDPIVF
jgi:hypothetical protein